MADPPGSEPLLRLETVECSPTDDETLAVRLHGRWRDRRQAPDARPILVVEVDGRRHRFPAVVPPRLSRIGRPGFWASNFALPTWLGPRLEGHTTVTIGDLEVAVRGFPSAAEGALAPPARGNEAGLAGAAPDHEGAPEGDALVASTGATERTDPSPGADATGADGVIAALREELHDRAAAQARSHGELADARAELSARAVNQEHLRATHDQLRAELERLSGLVSSQDRQRSEVESRAVVLAAELSDAQAQVGDLVSVRDELMAERDVLAHEVANLRAALASGIVSSDAATAESEGLRAELERLGSELAHARALLGSRESGLDEAEALLGEARALSASLRES